MDLARIEKAIHACCARTSAPLGVAFWDTESGKAFSVRGNEMFPIASVFKVFVLVELMRQRDAGRIDLMQRIPLEEGDFSAGSGMLLNFHTGCALTLHDYVYLMMAYSDNTATDIVIRTLGIANVHSGVMRLASLRQTKVDFNCRQLLEAYYSLPSASDPPIRGGRASFRGSPYFSCAETHGVVSTPCELMKTMRLLLENRFTCHETTQEILSIMKKCETNSRIPKLLPPEVSVAHKTGSLDRVSNDMGLVYTEKGTYGLVLLYNGNCAAWQEYAENFKYATGDHLLAELSLEIYKAYLT